MIDTAVTAPAPVPARAEANGFARVYERHHQALYRYCRSILRHEEDAQDALQSAMMRAFAALQTERRELELRPWLFRIAHNEAVSILRRRTSTCALDEDLRDGAALEDRVLEREALRLLRADLAGLTERQRWALILRELNGLSHGEIADVLETSPAVVKQAIFEARSALLRCREGRDTACADIRRVLSDGDGRVMRARRIRAHLQTCSGCRAFRDDLRLRPRRLAALAPPLPAGLAASLLRGLVGGSTGAASAGGGASAGLFAKAALGVALAGGAVASHGHPLMPVHRPAPAPSVDAKAAPAMTDDDDVVAAPPPIVPAARTGPAAMRRHRPGRTHALAPTTTAHRLAAPHKAERTRHPSPPGEVKKAGDVAAPAQKAKEADTAPLGQARTDTPPGQAEQPAGGTTPPGQAKTDVPPGQAKKPAGGTTPPGQAKTDVPPGQLKQPAGGTTPPGQAKKAAGAITPPGQAKPADGSVAAAAAPGHTGSAPGQAKPAVDTGAAAADPPGQSGTAAPPGQSGAAPGHAGKG